MIRMPIPVCFFLLAILLCSVRDSYGQQPPVKQVQLSHFQLQSGAVIHATGAELSGTAYRSADYWFPVTVPCTVLTGLVANKVYPDPYSGMNNMLIPDASDSFNHQYHLEQYSFLPGEPNPWKKPYWYRTAFSVPAADRGRHVELIFKGINYRAAVWLNGKLIADSSEMAGMFAEYRLDVSKTIVAGGDNALAVEIFPLDVPGLPATPQLKAMGDFYENGGPTGDIGKNVTMLSSVGWDWIPEVRDRNMGIWQPVFLRTSGQVVISNVRVITALPALPDTSTANLSLDLLLTNYGTPGKQGSLKCTIIPENFSGPSVTFTKPVTISGDSATAFHFSPANTPELLFHHPALWWPNGNGKPNLYRVRIQVVAGTQVSDDTSFLMGIRTVSSAVTDVNGWARRDFFVNGKKVHLVGGAWVPDMMLNRDAQRYDYELHLCQNARINMVRVWGGGLGETDEFYECADRYGLLVWQDFWITGDTHGGFKGSADWPLEGNIFVKNVISTIYRIRNHPSLLVWTGGNEGHAREALYNAMRDNVAALDGTRPFIPCSSGFSKAPKDWKGSWPDDKPAGVYSGGPYSWQEDAQYFKLVNDGKDWVFKDETGLPSQPPYNTLAKIIPNLVPDSSLPYPLNNTWGYHDACSGNGKYDLYYKAMVDRYGAPTGMKDFSDKMQLLNANGYRSIFEAAGHKLNETGGVMLWKLNAAFPSVIWQVFDWYLEPNAGYYFMQRACEPVHLQLNLDDSSVVLVNRSYQPQAGLRYTIEGLSLSGTSLYKMEGLVGSAAASVKQLVSLAGVLGKTSGVSFVLMSLKDGSGKPVSHNEYWMSPGHDFTNLTKMPASEVAAKVLHAESTGKTKSWTLSFQNTSAQLAFFLNPQVMLGADEVLPSFWSDNYFSVPAHGELTVTVSCPVSLVHGKAPELLVEGWNVAARRLSLR